MSELNDKMVFAELVAIRPIIWALIATHHDPELLRRRFDLESANLSANWLASGVSDQLVNVVELAMERWSKEIDKALANKTPPSE